MAGPLDLLEKGVSGVGKLATGGGAQASGGLVDRLGNALSSAPQALGTGIKAAAGFGPVGDAAGAVGAITGRDPLSGTSLKQWERGFTIAALGGIGLFAASMATGRGEHLLHAVAGGYRSPEPQLHLPDIVSEPRLPSEHQMIGVRPVQGAPRVVVTERTPSELAALNQPVPNQDLLFGTTKRFTNDVLSVSPDPLTGPSALAKTVLHAPEPDDVTLAATSGFFEALGRRLVSENLAHGKAWSTGKTGTADLSQYELSAAAYETARWQYAQEAGLLKGNKLKLAGKAWDKLRAGGTLTPEETSLLSDSMVGFSNAVWWVDHPELAMSPLVGIKGINLDDGDSVVDLNYLQFEGMPLDRMSAKEINNRVSQVFQTHPTSMVEPMANMVKNFYRTEVGPEGFAKWRDWYPQARHELDALSTELGVNQKALITTASILSAGEEWEQNVAKAGGLVKAVRSAGIRDIAAIANIARRAGLRVSSQDVVRTVFALELEDPLSFFTRGTTAGKGKTLDELGKLWEQGGNVEDLVDLRVRPQSHVALKQPSFTYGIAESQDADLENQAEVMAKLLTGETGALSSLRDSSAIHFSDLRRPLPVVVDRQAFKTALGFSLVPDTYLSGQKGVYDAIAQAYRIAAADIGTIEELGRPLLPEELQALTWMQWRENSRVNYAGAPTRPTFQMPGYRSISRRPAGWVTGHGPAYVYDDSILQQLTGNIDQLPMSGVDALDVGTDYTRFQVAPGDLNVPSKPVKGRTWRQVTLRNEADGTFKIMTPGVRPEMATGALRSRWPTKVTVDGEQVWAPVEAAQVDDVKALFDRWHKGLTSYEAADPRKAAVTGASLYAQGAPDLHLRPGHHLWITAPETIEGASGKLAHERLAAELKAQGIKFQLEHAPAPHTGITKPKQWTDPATGHTALLWSQDAAPGEIGHALTDAEWRNLPNVDHQEVRVGAAFTFDTPDDLHRAARWLEAPAGSKAPVPEITPDEVSALKTFANRDLPKGTGVVSAPVKGQFGLRNDEGELKAFLTLSGSPDSPEVVMVWKDPDVTEKGISRQLSEAATQAGWNMDQATAAEGARTTAGAAAGAAYRRERGIDTKTNGWDIYREQVLERIYYTEEAAAPAGTTRLLESRWKDGQGRELVNLNTAGDIMRSNTVPVYVPKDYADYITPTRTRSLDPASGGHYVEQRNGRWWLDGQAEITDPGEGVSVAPTKSENLQGAVRVQWVSSRGEKRGAVANSLLLYMPEGGVPQVSFGVQGKVKPAEILGADPTRLFEVHTSPAGATVRSPMTRGRTDGILASKVEDLLVRLGLTGKVHHEGRKI